MKVRPWNGEDSLRLIRWMEQDSTIGANFGLTDTDPVTVMGHLSVELRRPDAYYIAIEGNGTGTVGLAAATDINERYGSAVTHVVVNPRHRGKGYWVAKAAISYAFGELGLARLIGMIPKGNDLARRLDEKLGFHEPEDVDILILDRGEWDGEHSS